VLLGTYVTGQLTGSPGATGTYSINYPQAVSSGTAMMAVVPQISAAQAQLYFNQATLFLRNDGGGRVCDPTIQAMLLNMVVAHIAWLNYPLSQNGGASSPLVGRINSASEGSVSISSENNFPPGTVQWWQQTKYGAAFWAATAAYRTGFYTRAPQRTFGPIFPSGPVFPSR